MPYSITVIKFFNLNYVLGENRDSATGFEDAYSQSCCDFQMERAPWHEMVGSLQTTAMSVLDFQSHSHREIKLEEIPVLQKATQPSQHLDSSLGDTEPRNQLICGQTPDPVRL